MADDTNATDGNRSNARRGSARKTVLALSASMLVIAGAAAWTRSASDDGASQGIAVAPQGETTSADAAQSSESASVQTSDSATAIAPQNVSVVNNELRRDGVQWNPHGVQLIAFVQAPYAHQVIKERVANGQISDEEYQKKWKWFEKAYYQFSEQELNQIKRWPADTVRIQASLYALDPSDSVQFDRDFENKLVAGIKYARQIGLNVIVSLQGENQIGGMPPLPDEKARRVWTELAPRLRRADGSSDMGIILEMYNEPQLKPSMDSWEKWAAQMNHTAEAIRGVGAQNVLLADGLDAGQTLNGFIPLADPKMFYAVHAYFFSGRQTSTWWDAAFGNASRSVPVINGEWTTLTDGTYANEPQHYFCDADTGQRAVNLLQYQKDHGIGLVAVTYDAPKPWGGIVQDYNGTPTSFVGTDCQNALGRFGSGKTVQYWYVNKKVNPAPL